MTEQDFRNKFMGDGEINTKLFFQIDFVTRFKLWNVLAFYFSISEPTTIPSVFVFVCFLLEII